MNKIFVIFLALGLSGVTQASYLDDWSNDNLCGWMESASAPEYIKAEVERRKILCYGGVTVNKLPTVYSNNSQYGTSFPSPDPDMIEELNSMHKLGPKSKMGGY